MRKPRDVLFHVLRRSNLIIDCKYIVFTRGKYNTWSFYAKLIL